VGVAAGDDAGVYQMDDGRALVQTVDVFCPSVDDPYLFGQVAAANSLSDVYAMGGQPLTALSILGFPVRTAPDGVMRDILRGGIDKMAEAGVPVIGGHSIKDAEIKAGFAVTGLVDPARMMTNAGARPGDALVLTKPLGTGIIAFADQIGRAPPDALEAAARSMTALNRAASELMVLFGAHACTDVTGFGLMGHLAAMARASGVDVEITWDDLPLLPGVLECVGQGILPGGIERNRESSGASATLGKGVDPLALEVCLDPQTSGGLLVVLPEARAAEFVKRLHEAGVADAAVVGRVRGKGAGRVFLETRGTRPIPQPPRAPRGRAQAPVARAAAGAGEECCADTDSGSDACCSEGHGTAGAPAAEAPAAAAAGVAGAADTRAKFQAFMRSAVAPGALDAHTKEALAVALAIVARCEPCTRAHLKKARSMGFSDAEIDEAAWLAVSFGGSPVMRFYEAVRKG
jgi:selenide,water dikinase